MSFAASSTKTQYSLPHNVSSSKQQSSTLIRPTSGQSTSALTVVCRDTSKFFFLISQTKKTNGNWNLNTPRYKQVQCHSLPANADYYESIDVGKIKTRLKIPLLCKSRVLALTCQPQDVLQIPPTWSLQHTQESISLRLNKPVICRGLSVWRCSQPNLAINRLYSTSQKHVSWPFRQDLSFIF